MQEMTRRDFLKGAAMAGGAVMLGGLHGLGRVQAAGADAKVPEYDPLLDGVCDIHMHLAPDVKERCTDEYTFARNAQAAVYQFAKFGRPGRGIPVTGRNGKLLPEVVQVMEICAENGMIFATGHSAPEESILMAQKAHEMGFKKLVITHPNTTIWQMTADQIKRCADYGAYIEYCYLGRLWGEGSAMPEYPRQTGEEFLNYVRLVPERSFITTDLGQPGMPDPIDGMRTCIKELQSAGVPQRTIDILVRKNPAYLLGLEG